MPPTATAFSPDPAALIPVLDGLPAPWALMALLLYCTFVLHLIVMNALVGAGLITLAGRFARKTPPAPPHGEAAAEHAPDTLLPKGVAFTVNFAIPPFLFLQCIYGQYSYPGSVLMALWWLLVMAVVMLAYYGLYINMSRRAVPQRSRTLALGLAMLLLLGTAFLFVNNMTLLQSPERWVAYAGNSGGSFLNLADPQLWPRYLHIVLSCLAVGGLCLALPATLALRGKEASADPARRHTLRERQGAALRWFFHATLAQLPVGAWFLFSLPGPQQRLFMGGGTFATALFCAALFFVGLSLWAAWRRHALPCLAAAALVIAMMAGMRSLLRASLLEPWYRPVMRPFEAGPLALFAVSFVLSALILAWLAKVYWRHAPAAAADGPGAHPPDPATERMRRREAMLVIELGGGDKDDESDDESEGGRP